MHGRLVRTKLATQRELIHTTAANVWVYVQPGGIGKSQWDFKVSYLTENEGFYTPRHADLVRDTYEKLQILPGPTSALLDHYLHIIQNVERSTGFPPELTLFLRQDLERLAGLGLKDAPGLDLELLLVVFELVQIQEKTNYPSGKVPERLFRRIRENPEDLEGVAYLTEVGGPSNRSTSARRRKDELFHDLQGIVEHGR